MCIRDRSVVAVGDFDPVQVENIIKKYFDYTSDKKVTVPEDYRLAELKNKYIVFTDPEITYNTFYMTKILDRTITVSYTHLDVYKRQR